MGDSELRKVRRIALGLPGVTERLSHGEPCFFVQGKRPLCYFHDHHRGDSRISRWCPAPLGVPAELAASEPTRFFHPTPSASGVFATWLGVYLDTDGADRVDGQEIARVLEDAFRTVAPKTLIAELNQR
ncbi:MAG: MmcQ/YjbR family DNA-binding protein [Acidimicrobiales bacterium]